MPRKKQSGFTLAEMLFVVAIMAIVAGVAIPAFTSLLPGMRLKDSVRSIFVAINLTRSEAVKQNAVGIIKFDLAGNTFTAWLDDGPAGNNWALDASDTQVRSGAMETGVSISNTTIPYHTYGYNGKGLPAITQGTYDITLMNSEGKTGTVRIGPIGSIKIL